MKTTSILLTKKSFLLISTCLMLLIVEKATATGIGKPSFGAGVYTAISGNGFGLTYCPAISISSYQSNITIGPLINVQGINGISSVYSMILTESPNNFKAYFHNSSTYHNSGTLTPDIHYLIDAPEPEAKMAKLPNKYVVFENYTGFGINKNIFHSVSIDLNIGVGGYFTLNKKEIIHENNNYQSVRADNDFSMNARLGLVYDF